MLDMSDLGSDIMISEDPDAYESQVVLPLADEPGQGETHAGDSGGDHNESDGEDVIWAPHGEVIDNDDAKDSGPLHREVQSQSSSTMGANTLQESAAGVVPSPQGPSPRHCTYRRL